MSVFLESLPKVFMGTEEQLKQIVKLLATQIARSYASLVSSNDIVCRRRCRVCASVGKLWNVCLLQMHTLQMCVCRYALRPSCCYGILSSSAHTASA